MLLKSIFCFKYRRVYFYFSCHFFKQILRIQVGPGKVQSMFLVIFERDRGCNQSFLSILNGARVRPKYHVIFERDRGSIVEYLLILEQKRGQSNQYWCHF